MPPDLDPPDEERLGGMLAGTAPGDANPMQRFAAALLTQAGGLVEPVEPDGLEVLAPAPLQEALGVGELCRLGFGATLPAGAERVGIESDWLGRFDRLLGPRGRWTRRVLPAAGRRTPDAAALLEQELALDNATVRLLDAAPAWTRTLLLDFRFTAMSEEKREGTRRLAINLATGAMPDAAMERVAPLLGAEPVEGLGTDDRAMDAAQADLPSDWAPARLAGQVRRALPPRIAQALAPFAKGLERRLARDQDRLHAYHDDLHREALSRAAQLPEGDAGRERQAMRAAAVARDYQAKLDDLARKYALRVTVAWVQTTELVIPVHRLTVQVRRRKAERVVQMDWNSAARRLELPPCEATWSAERPRLACDDALHLVVPSGLAPCPGCGRAFCRACHAMQCPRCGHAAATGPFAAGPLDGSVPDTALQAPAVR